MAVYPPSSGQPQMICINPQDLLLFMQQMTSAFGRGTSMRPPLPEVVHITPPMVPLVSTCEQVSSIPAAPATPAARTAPAAPAPPATPATPATPDVLIMDPPHSEDRERSTSHERSPSPDFAWMFDEDPPAVVESVLPAERAPSPYRPSYFNYDRASTTSRRSKPCETSWREKSFLPAERATSPHHPARHFNFDKPSTSSSLLEGRPTTIGRSRRASRTPSPPSSRFAEKKRTSRHPTPDCFKDLDPRARSRSPSATFLDDESSCSPTSLLRSRGYRNGEKKVKSPSPAFLRDFEPSVSPGFSFLRGKPTSARQSDEKERSLSPDFAPSTNKKPKEADPDYSPSTSPKTAPKKRGRPRKHPPKPAKGRTPKAPVTCPICKEDTAGSWAVTRCGHYSHKECLDKWLQTPGQILRARKVCPVCSLDFDAKEVNPIYFGEK
ncbi:proteoglycan 4-like [Frankliniella occidentalis]|uniref:Proteoglycan 4-like n=1 Tax=Frankliniella occidentalis TaxID=133901 RepID=A0A9C6XVV2_FRAOC|nr:proteoglycan 4-like [Frankliniella occidentalis]